MSDGVNSAATLSLEISTDAAHLKLNALESRMAGLGAKLDGLLKAGTSVQGIDSVTSKIEDQGKQIAALNKQLTAMGIAHEAFNKSASAGLEGAGRAADRLKKSLEQVASANTAAAQAGNNAATIKLLEERARAAMAAAEAEKRLAQATRDNTAAARAANEAQTARLLANRAATASGRAVSSYDPLTNTTTVVQGVKQLEEAHAKLKPAVDGSAAGQINWNAVAKEGHTVARGLAGALGSLWITYGQLAPLLAGAALGGAFIHAAKAGSEFAYQLTFVKALSEETSASIDLLSRSAINLGKSSLQGPSEIADGFRVLAQAGLNVTDSIAAMPQVLHLATVGEMDMENAALTLVGVMNAFGLSISSVEHVGDVFAKAAAISQTSVQDMTQAMRTASVVGEQYGVSVGDTATALTLLAKVNIKSTAAGTSFRNMLKELYAPTVASEKALHNLGVTATDAAGNVRPFADVVFDLKDKLEAFNKGDQIKILQRLFGERGAKEAIAMMALTKDKWIEMRDAIQNSEGFMDGVAKELENTAKGRWAKAVNTMKSTLIEAFAEMEPAFKDLAGSFQSLFDDPAFISSLKQTVSAMVSLTKVVVDLTPLLIRLAEAWIILKAATISAGVWAAASAAVVSYAGALRAASGAMGPVVAGTTVAGTLLKSLPASFSALLTPMGLVVGGLAAAGLAFYLFRDRTAEAMEGSADKVRAFGSEASKILSDLERTLNVSSTSINQAKVGAAQTALIASNESLDAAASTYLKKYHPGKDIVGTGAAVEEARAYLQKQRDEYSGKFLQKLELNSGRSLSAKALVDASEEARKLQGKFYTIQDQVESKRIGEDNLAAVKAAQDAKPKTGKLSDILEDGKKTGRGELKDYRTIQNDNLSSALKREQIKLGTELVGVEVELAAQTISAAVAQERKNAASVAELEVEREIIAQYLKEATTKGDEVQIRKIQNDLDENALKIAKQREQAGLDLIKVFTANTNAIEDSGRASTNYAQDLQFEIDMLGRTSSEVARLRIEYEQMRAIQNLNVRADRNLDNPEVIQALRDEINVKAAARLADAEYQESYAGGWAKAYDAYTKSATSAAKQAADAFQLMSSTMENALDEFLTTGKLNFAEFAKSLILGMAKIEGRALLAKLNLSSGGDSGGGFGGVLRSLLGGIMSMFGGGASASTTAVQSAGGVSNSTPWAKGGAFIGSPSLHQYANTVQTTPRMFEYQNLHGFAKGGIFAEAGPEAVMPIMQSELGRDSKGRLGIKRQTGDTYNLKVIVMGNNNAPDVRRSAGQGAREALTALKGAHRFE